MFSKRAIHACTALAVAWSVGFGGQEVSAVNRNTQGQAAGGATGLSRVNVEGPRGRAKSWRSVRPGTSTLAEAIAALGQPSTRMMTPEGEVLEYATAGLPHAVLVVNGTVSLVAVTVKPSDLNLGVIAGDYGDPPFTAFSRLRQATRTYAWPTEGVEVVADSKSGEAIRLRLFVPRPLESYKATLGKSIPLKNPFIK